MLDTLVVGAGLCGLSLASKLQFAGRDYLLLDARDRLGGRIDTIRLNGVACDMGPTWFWPATQPRIARLIADLGLQDFAQHDSGRILHLKQGDASPEVLLLDGAHNGARRVAGGTRAIVDALHARVAPERIRLGYELTELIDHGTHVEARCLTGSEIVVIHAQRVVLSIPPRLVEERVRFFPVLDEPRRMTLRETPTWMAAQAKVLAAFPHAFWREAGMAGNAFVTHAQAVLGEVFDACTAEGAALGGFVALPPGVRLAFSKVLEMMAESQFGQLFGPQAANPLALHMRDWAQERHTCSARDADQPSAHPLDGVALLGEPAWSGRLLFGGSETAGEGAGYMEGALEAAARCWQQIAGKKEAKDLIMTNENPVNAESVARFAEWVMRQREAALLMYRQVLTRELVSQHKDQLTQRVVLEVVEGLYRQALMFIAGLPFERADVPVDKGRSALTPQLLQAFAGFSDALLTAAVTHNATSCAISNFPAEHDPDAAYLQVIRRDLAAAWREFALDINDCMLGREPVVEH